MKRKKSATIEASGVRVRIFRRGDRYWLDVRAGSKTGDVLFYGVLLEGRELRFTEEKIWVRAGAPSHLTVKLNGKILNDFPRVTSTVLVTPKGFRTLLLG